MHINQLWPLYALTIAGSLYTLKGIVAYVKQHPEYKDYDND